jgi:hypothetical protein
MKSLSREYGFGIAVSNWKIVPSSDSGKGDWSDGVAKYVPADDPEGLFSVYLGKTNTEAVKALEAETLLGDDAFGEILGIPLCCRCFYLDRRQRALSSGNDYLWETLDDELLNQAAPAGANIIAQYFGRCLLSHFPCRLHCRASRMASATRRKVLSLVAPQFADYLAESHFWTTVVLRGRGMVAYPQAIINETQVQPDKNVVSIVIGEVPSSFTEADVLFVDREDYVVAENHGNVVAREPRSGARLVIIENIW